SWVSDSKAIGFFCAIVGMTLLRIMKTATPTIRAGWMRFESVVLEFVRMILCPFVSAPDDRSMSAFSSTATGQRKLRVAMLRRFVRTRHGDAPFKNPG